MASTFPASSSPDNNNNNGSNSAAPLPPISPERGGGKDQHSTTGNSTSNKADPHAVVPGASAKAAAQELAAWYLDEAVDPLQPHAANVHHYLRGPVTELTASVLSTTTTKQTTKQTAPKKKGNTTSNNSTDASSAAAAVAPEDHPLNRSSMNSSNNNYINYSNSNDWQKFLPNHHSNNGNKQNDPESAIQRDRERLGPRARARLDAFLEGVALAVVSEKPAATAAAPSHENKPVPPRNKDFHRHSSTASAESYGLVEGLVGFQNLGFGGSNKNSSSRPRSASITKQSSGSIKIARCPQILQAELVTRLELYLRGLHRVVSQHHDGAVVVALEPVKALRARTRSLVRAFVATVGTVQHVSPVLTRLLTCLTKELLAVPTLSENLTRVIRRIVSDYVHTTSFASLAFLSSPETAADRRLTPVILQYLLYLQKHWQHCERECNVERMLEQALDRDMRHTFKTAEFQSIGHLLEVCSLYRQELQNIELACSNANNTLTTMTSTTTGSSSAKHAQAVEEERLNQAVRDLQREVITVNGSVLPTVNNRTDLIELLASALNTRSVLDAAPAARRGGSSGKKKSRTSLRKQQAPRTTTTPPVSGTSESESDYYSHHANGFSSADGYQSNSSAAVNEFATPNRKLPPMTPTTTASTPTPAQTPPPRRRSTFRLSTVDFLTKRLLLAASRTGTGGDAYFVVRDLFGGDDVEVVPSKQYPFTVGARNAATIDLLVRLASVTIRCHASFDVYPKSLVGDCEPLIQIHTTTTETILLQEVRAADQMQQQQQQQQHPQPGSLAPSLSPGGATPVMVLQERPTENSGKRILSVKPALYEKVEVWNTPS